jgi:hypothetical protein
VLLSLIVSGLASGQPTPSAVAQWVREHAEKVRPLCGGRVPSETAVRRCLVCTDVTALETHLDDFAQRPPAQASMADTAAQPWEVRALDGKTVHGVGAHGVRVHLVSEVR